MGQELSIPPEVYQGKTKKCDTQRPSKRLKLSSLTLNDSNSTSRRISCKEITKVSQDDDNKQENAVINEYVFLRVIGKGNFGSVYLVKSNIDDCLYALKTINKHTLSENGNINNIKTEKRILKMCNHPFIVSMHCVFQDNKSIYLLLDFCNGGELYYHLQKNKKFNEETAKFYTAQIYLVLSYLHSNGIIYRDLKPENIILDMYGYLKLIDFGLAKDKFNSEQLTKTICGTKEYIRKINSKLIIAPEVILGNKYGYNYDWWAFGIIIYEMLIGIPPFYNDSKTELYRDIVYNEPDFKFLGIDVNISNEAKDLLLQLLKKDPKERIKPENIPKHSWFEGINFDYILLRKLIPPYIPNLVS
jgi:serine/threonine protein kinase